MSRTEVNPDIRFVLTCPTATSIDWSAVISLRVLKTCVCVSMKPGKAVAWLRLRTAEQK